jgi:AcrR family transcriptional regulator
MSINAVKENKKVRGRPKTIVYDTTLDIAMRAYWSKGIDGMSVNEICRLANVSKPSLYREFGNEDKLLARVFQHYALGFHKNLKSLLNKNRNFSDSLSELIDFSSSNGEKRIHPKGCLGVKGFQSFDRLGTDSKIALAALRSGTIQIFEEWVFESRNFITLGSDWKNNTISEYIFSIFANAMRMSDQGESPENIKKIMSLALSPLVYK